MSNIRLVPLDRSNWRQALLVRTGPGQSGLAADHEPVALVILSKCYVQPGDLTWEPFGILEDNQMVGVFALAHALDSCELLHFTIDVESQGRGVGRTALKLVIDHVRQAMPGCREITLTVHPLNDRAQRLYDSAGFVATDEMRHGECVCRWALE